MIARRFKNEMARSIARDIQPTPGMNKQGAGKNFSKRIAPQMLNIIAEADQPL
jgi:hypothetical protein